MGRGTETRAAGTILGKENRCSHNRAKRVLCGCRWLGGRVPPAARRCGCLLCRVVTGSGAAEMWGRGVLGEKGGSFVGESGMSVAAFRPRAVPHTVSIDRFHIQRFLDREV